MQQSTGTEEGFAEVNGARLYYQVAGNGHPLVLLHAGVADHTMWDRQFEQFALKYRVVRYDHRGFGQSSMPEGEFSLYEDLDGLLHHLDIDRAYLIGVSIGGSAVIDYAIAHPEKVAAIMPVAAGISGKQPSEGAEKLYAAMEEAYQAHDLERVLEEELALWLVGPNRSPDEVSDELKEHFRRMERHNLEREFAGAEGHNRSLDPPAVGRLAEIKAPMFVVAGEADLPDVLSSADMLVANVPGTEKVILPNVAHMVPMEAPKEFNRLALQFLARCDALT